MLFSYVHIPFCRQKCHYCKFALTPVFNDTKIELYLAHLKKEITSFLGKRDPDVILKSIYFGGGTPSILKSRQIEEIVSSFRQHISFSEDIEITLESNPEDITDGYTKDIKEIGINRLSLGVQSLNPLTLKEVGRSDPETIFGALDAVFSAGFKNVNVDFILGLPYTKKGDVATGVKVLLDRYPLTHISLYLLEEELYPAHWKDISLKTEEMQEEHGKIRLLLEEKGLKTYEISNFATPGFESRHNRAYWNHSDVRGFGLSAASYLGGRRFANNGSFVGYYDGKISYDETLDEDSLRIERLMFGIRTDGMNPEDITYFQKCEQYIEEGLLEERNGKIIPTSAGIFLIDHIIGELI